MDINNISKPIVAICLVAVLIVAGIGLFIPNYKEAYSCELLVLQDFQVDEVSIQGMNSFTITGIYLGDEPSFDSAENYKGDLIQFLVDGSAISSSITGVGFIGGDDGDTRFYINGNSQRLLMPRSVEGMRIAGKRLEFSI